jgi:ribosome biogenesis GTPase / thiamine phosphate phosphatase
MRLRQLGWNGFFEAQWNSCDGKGGRPARVIAEYRGMWQVAGEFGEGRAAAAGRLRWSAGGGAEWPAVGDWVSVGGNPCRELVICDVLQRRSAIVRKEAGKRVVQQVLAANVDTVFLVMALDGDFSPRRLERYLTQVWDSGARPVILLNKMDLCTKVVTRIAEIEAAARGVPAHAVSATSGEGIGAVESQVLEGATAVLLGSSGVGKSSLVNRLLGREAQTVQEVRDHDCRGRHTSTARQLFFLSSGAMIIDTPGLRELQLWDSREGLQHTFGEIAELGELCRYGDCTHQGEPGCAVEAGILGGRVDPARLENHLKLQRELAYLQRKINAGERQKEKQRIKTTHRATQKYYQQRGRSEGK